MKWHRALNERDQAAYHKGGLHELATTFRAAVPFFLKKNAGHTQVQYSSSALFACFMRWNSKSNQTHDAKLFGSKAGNYGNAHPNTNSRPYGGWQ